MSDCCDLVMYLLQQMEEKYANVVFYTMLFK